MKKYLIIGNGESPHILKWVNQLAGYFELYLVSSQDTGPKILEVIPDKRIFSFHLNVSESGGNVSHIRMVIPLIRIIRKVNPDIVNAHYITSHGVVAALAKKISRHPFSLIQSAWGSDISTAPFRNGFYKTLTSFALNQAKLATTDSARVAGIIHTLSGVETMTFPFGLEHLPGGAPFSKTKDLFFSNRTLNANSNIDRIIHFFNRVLQENSRARLVIANEGPLKGELMALAGALGIQDAIEFTGFLSQEKQQEYYRKARFYFSIPATDALSVSLLEAMAFGCIPLVSDLPDNREWVTDGINGLIFNEHTTPETISVLQERSPEIAGINRDMIARKAIFPDSIELFYKRIIDF